MYFKVLISRIEWSQSTIVPQLSIEYPLEHIWGMDPSSLNLRDVLYYSFISSQHSIPQLMLLRKFHFLHSSSAQSLWSVTSHQFNYDDNW